MTAKIGSCLHILGAMDTMDFTHPAEKRFLSMAVFATMGSAFHALDFLAEDLLAASDADGRLLLLGGAFAFSFSIVERGAAGAMFSWDSLATAPSESDLSFIDIRSKDRFFGWIGESQNNWIRSVVSLSQKKSSVTYLVF